MLAEHMAPLAVAPAPPGFDWATFWAGVGGFVTHFQVPFTIIGIFIGASVLRVV